MSIENAAREIAKTYFDTTDEQGNYEEMPHLCEIIRRHLFPSVKPEEVRPRTWYFSRLKGREEWNCVYMNVLGFLSGDRISAFDEIRGPIQMPE